MWQQLSFILLHEYAFLSLHLNTQTTFSIISTKSVVIVCRNRCTHPCPSWAVKQCECRKFDAGQSVRSFLRLLIPTVSFHQRPVHTTPAPASKMQREHQCIFCSESYHSSWLLHSTIITVGWGADQNLEPPVSATTPQLLWHHYMENTSLSRVMVMEGVCS